MSAGRGRDRQSSRGIASVHLLWLGLVFFVSAYVFDRDEGVHPLRVWERLSADGTAVDLAVDHSARSIWVAVLVMFAALFAAGAVFRAVQGRNRVWAQRIYRPDEEKHPLAREERRRRVDVVDDWRRAFGLLVSIVVAVEIATAALVVVALNEPPGPAKGYEHLIAGLYIVRAFVWPAGVGFWLWAWARPRLFDRVYAPRASLDGPRRSKEPRHVALAFSGGGVRSAAFSLGALDALQRAPRLWREVRHICAVSGGAYAAGAWANLHSKKGSPDLDRPLFELGSPELQHVRNQSTYLAPRITGKVRAFNEWGSGALVTLTLYSASVFVMGTLFGCLAGALQRDATRFRPGAGLWALALLAGFGVGSTIYSHRLDEREARDRRRCGEVLGWIFVLAGFLVVVVPGFLVLANWAVTTAEWAFGLAAALTGAVLTSAAVWSMATRQRTPLATFLAGLIMPLLTVAGLAVAARWAAGKLAAGWSEGAVGLWPALIAVSVIMVFGLSDATKMSVFPFYRRRLSEAFAVRWLEDPGGRVVHDDTPAEWPADRSAKSKKRVETVICAAANVLASQVTPPGRGSLSFTFSPRRIGLPGRPGEGNAWAAVDRDPAWSGRRTSMCAVAISGAAISPGMGKMTKRSYEALLALLNVRIGVWLPNPLAKPWHEQRPGSISKPREALVRQPRMITYFFKELLGLHGILDSFVYVTDGGHWDNLGLVEALRRRPEMVICFDSSGDPPGSFAALGESIALAGTELGATIHIDTSPLAAQPPPRDGDGGPALPEGSFVAGAVEYDGGDQATLVYCRAMLSREAPLEVHAFGAKDPAFPHTSTLRQLFDDETFEAYRALGFSSAEAIRDVLVAGPLTPPRPTSALAPAGSAS